MSRALVAGAAALVLALPAHAQPAAAAAPATEPNVQRTVVEDGGARIEELRVRGRLQRVTVQPKGGAKPYEIVVGEGTRNASDGQGGSRGAAGQRVWHVLSF